MDANSLQSGSVLDAIQQPNDLTVLEHGVRNLKKQISLDKSQPESLRKEMQVQLAIPLKHKQVEVIDMDNSDDAPL